MSIPPKRPRNVLNAGAPPPHSPAAALAEALRLASLDLMTAHFHPEQGGFAYEAAATSPAFDRYRVLARALPGFDPHRLEDRGEKLAFWLNLYNALTVHAVLVFRPWRTVWSVPGFFRRAAYDVGGHRFSLDDIEHGVLRANRPASFLAGRLFRGEDPRLRFALAEAEFDPRIHFALNCASRSCPPIAFYTPAQVADQLDLATRAFLTAETEVARDRVVTTALLKWYRRDFTPDPAAFLARYVPPEVAVQIPGRRLAFRPYDWRLHTP